MKTMSGTVVLGILLTLAMVWYLGDLGHGAVALVTILSLGIAGLVISGFRWMCKRGKER
jgi:hypothetical protein